MGEQKELRVASRRLRPVARCAKLNRRYATGDKVGTATRRCHAGLRSTAAKAAQSAELMFQKCPDISATLPNSLLQKIEAGLKLVLELP